MKNIQIMRNFFGAVTVMAALAACGGIGGGAGGGTGAASPFVKANAATELNGSYTLADVNLTLRQNDNVEENESVKALPAQAEVEKMFRQYVYNEMAARGLYSKNSATKLNVDITYTRVFAGETFGTVTGWGPSTVNYVAKVERDGYSVASSRRANAATDGGFGKMLAGVSVETEQQYLREIAAALVSDLAAATDK